VGEQGAHPNIHIPAHEYVLDHLAEEKISREHVSAAMREVEMERDQIRKYR
jgi:hypothetical protein